MAVISHVRKLAKHERWWFVTWSAWGLIVASIVFCIDRSATAGLVWIAAGLFAGVFGQSFFERLCERLFRPSGLLSSPNLDQVFGDEKSVENPFLWLLANETFELANPCRKPWELYPAIPLAVGVFHGALVGTVYGSLLPVLGDFSSTSFQGAWQGLIAGSVLVCLLYASILPIVFVSMHRGPSLEPVRNTVWQAAQEADQLGHEGVSPVHLLLAILRNPTGRAARFFDGHEEYMRRCAYYLRNQLAEESPTLDDSGDAPSLFFILQDSASEAKTLGHDSVDSAHLLLAMLNVCPTATIDVLKKAGFGAAELRPRIIECLSHPAS